MGSSRTRNFDLSSHSDGVYLPSRIQAAPLAGLLLKVFAWLAESRVIGAVILYFFKKGLSISKLFSSVELQEPPLHAPLHPFEETEEKAAKSLDFGMSAQEKVQQAVDCLALALPECLEMNFRRWTILDYAKSYTSQQTTPIIVAEKLIAAVLESSNPSLKMSFFINFNVNDILKQAKESTLRYQRGEPLSVLDGVPVAVKDEFDCLPYPTTGGTKWLHKSRPVMDDAYCIKQLRLCGATIIGKTNMQELGVGVSGINSHYGAVRNPYDRSKITGGSSSGSAATVAAGLCPVALGVDGGGSVRIPASLCGVVGIKPTFDRISRDGVIPLNYTVGMVGILAATVEDALIVYAAVSGHVSSDPLRTTEKINQPEVCLPQLKSAEFTSMNIKMAIFSEWFDECTADIRTSCSNAVQKLCNKYGWKTLEVTIPELEMLRLAHYITIGSECTASMSCYLDTLNKAEMGWDARAVLSLYASFQGAHYIKAQAIRNRQLQFHKRIFHEADIIVTPTVGTSAYTIKENTLRTGEVNYQDGAALAQYMLAGNFLGLPAITVPVGYDTAGLPIGLHLMGKPWSESLLLHVAYAIQALFKEEYRQPDVFYDLLSKD